MNLTHSLHYAVKIIEWLAPYCTPSTTNPHGASLCVAGSIRRERPACNDVDIVCIPRIDEAKDLLGVVTERKNQISCFLEQYAASGKAKTRTMGPRQVLMELPKCQLDLWFADEKNWATRLLCRTGSMQHNIWIAEQCKRRGLKFASYEGILSGGKWIPGEGEDQYEGGHLNRFATEEEFYRFIDLPFIEPKNRELEYLIKNFGQWPFPRSP